MPWVLVFFAGLLEIAWAASIKQSHGFTRLWPTVSMLVTMTGSITLLALAMRSLPLGTAYATFTGIGAAGAFLIGIVFLGEQASFVRVTAAVLVISGLILMNLSDQS